MKQENCTTTRPIGLLFRTAFVGVQVFMCHGVHVEAGQAVSPFLPSMLFGTKALVLCAAYGRLAGLGTSRNSPVSVP